MLNRVQEELPSASEVAKADDTELQEIMENTAKSTKDLITQLDDPPGDSLKHALHQLLGLDKELRSTGDLLKVETVKKVQLEKCIERESLSFPKSETTQNMMMAFKKTSGIGSKGLMTT